MATRTNPPICTACDIETVLVTGALVYGKSARPPASEKPFWRCPDCGAFTGCHPGTKKPLGVPADRPLRDARATLQTKKIDPLWRSAQHAEAYDRRYPQDLKGVKMIQNAARRRVYRWLAAQLNFDGRWQDFHIGSMSMQMCRDAWTMLSHIDYPSIRLWAILREKADEESASKGEAA